MLEILQWSTLGFTGMSDTGIQMHMSVSTELFTEELEETVSQVWEGSNSSTVDKTNLDKNG